MSFGGVGQRGSGSNRRLSGSGGSERMCDSVGWGGVPPPEINGRLEEHAALQKYQEVINGYRVAAKTTTSWLLCVLAADEVVLCFPPQDE